MKRFLKVEEVAQMCGCCEETVIELIDYFRANKKYRLIPLEEALKLRDIVLVDKKISASTKPIRAMLMEMEKACKPLRDLIEEAGKALKPLREAEKTYKPFLDMLNEAQKIVNQYKNINQRRPRWE